MLKHPDHLVKLKDYLKAQRELGIDRHAFAEEIGITYARLTKLVVGERNMTLPIALRIHDATRCRISMRYLAEQQAALEERLANDVRR